MEKAARMRRFFLPHKSKAFVGAPIAALLRKRIAAPHRGPRAMLRGNHVPPASPFFLDAGLDAGGFSNPLYLHLRRGPEGPWQKL